MKMFEKKRCPNCGEKIKENWRFCPHCGEEIKVSGVRPLSVFSRPFKNIFTDIEEEFERIDKMFESDFRFPSFKMRPVKTGGISITIHSGTGMEPKVEVKTFGDYKKFEPELKRKLGVSSIEEVEEKRKIPKVVEEPETKIKKIGNKQIISIKLPGVKGEDIEIRKLEQSIEVKAFAGDKAYFKLIPIPAGASVNKEFKNGVLKIEIVR